MEDSWVCPQCCRPQPNVTKKISFWSLPDILVIHLKRFEQVRAKMLAEYWFVNATYIRTALFQSILYPSWQCVIYMWELAACVKCVGCLAWLRNSQAFTRFAHGWHTMAASYIVVYVTVHVLVCPSSPVQYVTLKFGFYYCDLQQHHLWMHMVVARLAAESVTLSRVWKPWGVCAAGTSFNPQQPLYERLACLFVC